MEGFAKYTNAFTVRPGRSGLIHDFYQNGGLFAKLSNSRLRFAQGDVAASREATDA
jgi:hypothetical protein